MDYILATLLSYLLLYKYIAIAVIIFLSGLVLPLPSNTILLAAGAFASQGYMSAIAVFLVALVSNVVGDSVGYSLTRFWGTRIISEARLRSFPAVIWVERFVKEHSAPAIVATRFLGTPGVIVNFFSGLLRIPFHRFVFFDIIGNALDTACFIVIGYMLGVYTEGYSDISQLVGWVILIIVLIYATYKLFLKKK